LTPATANPVGWWTRSWMARKDDSNPDPRIVRAQSGHSEITRENTSVTYVIAFTIFYGARRGFAVPTRALCWYKSGYSETIVLKH
jgi:hypothetical protein